MAVSWDEAWRPGLRWAGLVLAGTAAILGTGMLLCWGVGRPDWMLCFSHDFPAAPKGALTLGLLGGALVCRFCTSGPATRSVPGLSLACLSGLVVAWGYLEVALGRPGWVEARLGLEAGGMAEAVLPPLVRFGFAGLASLLVGSVTGWPRSVWATAASATAAILASVQFVMLTGWLYAVPGLDRDILRPPSFLGMAAGLCLSLGVVMAGGPERIPLRWFWWPTHRAHLLRAFVPWTVGVVLACVGLLQWLGFHGTVTEPVQQFLLLVLPPVLVLGAGLWVADRAGARVDALESSLRRAALTLEERVRQRTAEEASWRESAEQFQTLANQIPALVCIRTGQGCVYANEGTVSMFGVTREELRQRGWWRFVEPEWRGGVERLWAEAATSATPVGPQELLIRTAAGQERWLQVTARAVRFGGAPAVLICGLDVTDLRQTARRLMASEELFRQVVEHLQEVFWLRDGTQQRWLYVSRAFETVWGLPRARLYENPALWWDRVHPEDALRVRAAWEAAAGQDSFEQVYRVLRSDGGIRWVYERAFRVRQTEGAEEAWAGVVEDITAWKESEQSLRASEERFRTLFECAPLGVALLDAQGHFLRVNRAYCEMLGYSEVEMLQLSTRRITHPEDVAAGRALYEQLRSGQRDHYAREKRLLRKDGRVVQALSAAGAVRDEQGRLRYIVSTVLDITERKRLQQEVLEAGARERRRIGHELHDGLAQFLAGLALKARSLEDRLRQEAPASASEAAELVSLLGRAMQEARRLARGLDPVEVEAGGLVPALQRLAAETTEWHGVLCECTCPEPVEKLDGETGFHLFRIAQEAVANAVRHGKPRRVGISLQREGPELCLRIVDDGRGFGPEEAANAEGLGLRTMRYRAATLRARLKIHSQAGQGTTVECRLPWPAGRDPREAQEA
jgi:PAS domain S-box-containing protein